MNKKEKGNRLEREVKKDLEKKGMFVVNQKSSFFPDIVAIRRLPNNQTDVWIVECKSGDKPYLRKREESMLKVLAEKLGVQAYFVYKIREGKRKKIIYKKICGQYDKYYFCDFICEARDKKGLCFSKSVGKPEMCKHHNNVTKIEKGVEFVA